mgnify:CR=1 FL=1
MTKDGKIVKNNMENFNVKSNWLCKCLLLCVLFPAITQPAASGPRGGGSSSEAESVAENFRGWTCGGLATFVGQQIVFGHDVRKQEAILNTRCMHDTIGDCLTASPGVWNESCNPAFVQCVVMAVSAMTAGVIRGGIAQQQAWHKVIETRQAVPNTVQFVTNNGVYWQFMTSVHYSPSGSLAIFSNPLPVKR